MRKLTIPRWIDCMAAIASCIVLSGCGSGGDDTAADPTLVQTQQGPVKGTAANGVQQFLGLPYAAPPTGPLRWMPPAPVVNRTTVLDASQPGSECLQVGPPPSFAAVGHEDCLYLNIYRPDPAPTKPAPVIFAIHGGGYALGSGAFIDGTSLAKNYGLIVVSINYRLNALGFLAHPALSAEDTVTNASGNYGLLDQVAALTWVKQNIAAFGGDPANVTINGDSAGGYSVYSHLASPMSAGLFSKAVPQSGGFTRIQATIAQAEAAGVSFSAPWNCNSAGSNPQIAACLRALPPGTTLSGDLPPPQTGTGNQSSWLPIVDGRFLGTSTSLAFGSGSFNKVPMMIGFVNDEGTFFVCAPFCQSPITSDTYEPVGIQGYMGISPPDPVSALYPLADYPSPNQALARVYGDYRVVCGIMQDTDNIASALPVGANAYVYQFSEEHPYQDSSSLSMLLPPSPTIAYGAFHGSDLPYLFEQMPESPTAPELALAQVMSGALANFALTGNPNSNGAFPQWQPYTASQRGVFSFSQSELNANFDAYDAHQCSFWYAQPPTTHL